MLPELETFFKEEHITETGCLSETHWKITYHALMERTVPGAESAVFFLLPYYTGDRAERNISLYAVAKDYHLYAKRLSEKLLPVLKSAYPGNVFALFTDHSPFDERECAARAGLGMIGENGLLIHKKYGSYVFIAEIVSDRKLGEETAADTVKCPGCGACRRACPKTDECLSSVTQKKGKLSEAESELIARIGSAWGCDLCQTVCPYNKGAAATPIAFFHEERIWQLTDGIVSDMADEAFAARAYSWRKRETLLRNLAILAKRDGEN